VKGVLGGSAAPVATGFIDVRGSFGQAAASRKLFVDEFDNGGTVFVGRAVDQTSALKVDRAENRLGPFLTTTYEICQGLEVELIAESRAEVACNGFAAASELDFGHGVKWDLR
jgi:hypothetical protein